MAFRQGKSTVPMSHIGDEDTRGKAHNLSGLEDQKRDAGKTLMPNGGIL